MDGSTLRLIVARWSLRLGLMQRPTLKVHFCFQFHALAWFATCALGLVFLCASDAFPRFHVSSGEELTESHTLQKEGGRAHL